MLSVCYKFILDIRFTFTAFKSKILHNLSFCELKDIKE